MIDRRVWVWALGKMGSTIARSSKLGIGAAAVKHDRLSAQVSQGGFSHQLAKIRQECLGGAAAGALSCRSSPRLPLG